MEITKMNIISDFVSPLSKVPLVYVSFWRWGALIFAVFATFTSLFSRIKLYILRLHSIRLSASQHLQQLDDSFDFSDTDEDREITCVTESIDDDLDSDEIGHIEHKHDEALKFSGSCFFKNRREVSDSEYEQPRIGCDFYPWSEYSSGKSVVKQWDSLGVGLEYVDYNLRSEADIPDLWDDQEIWDIFGGKRAGEISYPVVTYLSGKSNGNGFAGYDRRMRPDIPVISAEWGSRLRNVVGVGYGGVEKVYVKYGISGGACTIGDLRNFRNPLEN